MHMKSFYLTGIMLSAIVGEKTGGNAMFGKFQDSLLFVVLAYAIFRIGWGEGFTTMNIFILLGWSPFCLWCFGGAATWKR